MSSLENSLIAHYKMNEDAASKNVEDSSGNNHDGLAQQDTDDIHRTGKINGAFDFNGTSDYIAIPDHSIFSPGDGVTGTPFSISAWVYMHAVTNFRIASKGVLGTDGEWRLMTDASDKLSWLFWDESNDNYIALISDDALTGYINTWIHIVATSDGGTSDSGLALYVNVIRVDATNSGMGAFTAIENDLGHDVWIGRYSTTYADGLIDNVMFFNKELTQRDVDILNNKGSGIETFTSYLRNPLIFFNMLTLNGIPTESFQNVTIEGDLQVDGAVDFTNHKELVWEGEVLYYENEILTYTD